VWKEPKINWSSNDFVNYLDYNRIIENIAYLVDLGNSLYMSFPYKVAGEKTLYSDFPYASDFNIIEQNLDILKTATFPFVNFVRGYWVDNGRTPDYNDLNRIESACIAFHDGYERQKKTQQRISITLGREQSAIKV